ncbi:Tat-linked quality control protein TatD [Methanobrevibacter curvatus]|uniref:Tat-linked quality control protein TatD n=2 Tax=Methanobrevibacter curvatus TaxID=49547 RepID=A0A166C7M2_9EURY|nr:Tat-linked quality control protein TatD [Methanobrevibacter curvatus]
MTAIINSGTSFDGNISSLKLANKHDGFIYTSFGFHPISSAKIGEEVLNKVINQTISHMDEIVAIGEVGLDFFYVKDKSEREKQKKIFHKFAHLANEYKKPILIHCRDAERKAFNIIKDYEDIPEVIFHCFSGSLKTAKRIMNLDYKMSVATMICYSKKHQDLFKEIPLEYILTETDSPYLALERGLRNEPVNVKNAIKKIAQLKGISYGEVDKITESTAKKVFGI